MVLFTCVALAGVDEVTVSVGARDTLQWGNGPAEGGTLGVRLASREWEIGAAQYARIAGDAPSPLTVVLLERAGGSAEQPEDVDAAATSLWVSWGPVGEKKFWGAPRLVLGLEGRVVDRRLYTSDPSDPADPDRSGTKRMFGVGPVGGVAFDARLGSPLGVRLSLLDRTWFGPTIDPSAPDGRGDGTTWFHSPTLSLDLSWSL
jgi:hypothetical protein